MTMTPEQLAAYADGELDEVTAVRVRKEIAADPALVEQLGKLTALREQLASRFDPILTSAVPERLTLPIEEAAKIVDFSAVRASRQNLWQRREFRFGAGAALAASLVAVILVGGRTGTPQGYAGTQLAAALDQTLSGQSAPDGTRMLLSFRDRSGKACRGYADKRASGIACRDEQGWKIEVLGGSARQQSAEYRQAGSADAAVMTAAQDMAVGPALDAAEEAAARQSGWKPAK